MRIKQRVLEKIAADTQIRAKLCAALNKAYPTVQRYVEENDENLTKASALKVIREELRLTDNQILEEVKQSA